MDDRLNAEAEITLAPYNIPCTRIVTATFESSMLAEVTRVMQSHGGNVEELRQADKLVGHVLTFPVGTVKTEIWPRVHNSRFEVVTPDGFKVIEHEAINGDHSIVRFLLKDFPREIQEKHKPL